MQELNYQLEKEDYLDWIHWNVSKQNLKKAKITTAIIYGVFLLIYLGGSIAAKKDPISLFGTLILVLALGAFMFYMISAKHQEKVIWKRSGLKRMEQTVGFPAIQMNLYEDHVIMEVPGQMHKDYSYTEIMQIEETERLFLLGTSDKTWQFVAKSAFENQEQQSEFKTFMDEKIADAKENPEKYKKAPAVSDGSAAKKAEEESGSQQDSWTPDEAEIEPVDTSKMGKIGKMAHIMAAMAADNVDGEETSVESPVEAEAEALPDGEETSAESLAEAEAEEENPKE